MAVRKATRRAPQPETTKAGDPAVTWTTLLEEVVTAPGLIAAAYTTFHTYSLGNALLAVVQASARGLELGPMASYGTWQSLGRQVRKGEKAIWLNMPRTARRTETDAQTGEQVERRKTWFLFGPATFLVSQTEPIEGQEDRSATLLTREGVAWERDRALAALDVTLAPFDDLDGNLQGLYSPATRTLQVSPVAAHPERTLLHELAHSILHADGYAGCESRGVAEAEAESVAMLVAASLGLDGVEESRGYVQRWLHTTHHRELNEGMARRIFAAAHRILAAGLPAAAMEAQAAA